MKTKHRKAAAAAVSLLIVSSPALATSTGRQTLGQPRVAMDVFSFECPPGTPTVIAGVNDVPPVSNVAHMRVTLVGNVGEVFVAQGEDISPGIGRNGPEAKLGGPGPDATGELLEYVAIFHKTAGGKEDYIGEIVCSPGTNPELEHEQDG